MAEKNNDLSVTLPEELQRQFVQVERRLWLVETSVAAATAIGGLALSLLALFISDRIWNTPPILRLIFSLAGLAVVAVAFWRWARRWLWRKRSLEDLANLVQRKYRRLGDRLLGIVELSHEQRHQQNFSPALYHAAIHQVAEEARQYNFRESIATEPARKSGGGAAVVVICLLALCLILPAAGWNTIRRWLVPTADIPRYTLVRIEGLPKEMIVPHGESFAVTGNVDYRSMWKPQSVIGQLAALPKFEGSVESGKIHLQVPGQVENGVLRVKVGDAMADIRILPVHRPSLRELTASIQLPDYLQYSNQTQQLQSGSLVAVEGSRIAFKGTTSRPLVSAEMQTGKGKEAPLKISGETFFSAPAEPEGMDEYTFNWRDDLGLTNASPLHLSVATQKDASPVPILPDLPHDTAMLASDVLHIRAGATDDFGVRDFGLTWDVSSDVQLTEGYTTEVKIMPPSPRVKKAERVFLWSPQVYRIPADTTVELQGFARDFLPDRERSRTAPYRIRILSAEEHAELIRGQLEAAMARMEEVTRLEEKIAANLGDLKNNDKLPESQKSARLGQSKNDQLDNASHLKELSQKAQQAVQEAMKNPLFPPDTIRQWSQSAQQWQKLSDQKMQDAAASMKSAQENSPQQKQQMSDASQKAQDILKQLEKMQNTASEHMDQLQALTLSKRLRKVGTQEKEIGDQLIKTAPDTIGLTPDELPDKFKKFDMALTTDQGKARKESETLQGEISRFFERTQKTNYGAVSKEMKEARTSDELDRLGGLIEDNVAMQASGDLGQWSRRFEKWGDSLEPKPDNASSGQGSSGKSQEKKDLTEQLIALLRLRENESTLRDQTSVLDQQKGAPSEFKEKAGALANTQGKMIGELRNIQKKADLPSLDSVFSDVAGSMNSAAAILQKPETGKPADDAESKTMNSLSDLVNLINEQAQRAKPQPSPGSSSSSAEEMAFLMQMMKKSKGDGKAMALQPATGLNHAGGSTDRAGNPVTGNVNGKGASAREVQKASGVIENAPVEFRDALDNYFHGIEHSKD
jgi:hypothetical protein